MADLSYQIGQFRKTNLTSYMSPIGVRIENISLNSQQDSLINYEDKVITTLDGSTFNPSQSYFLSFSITKDSTEQNISIFLQNSSDTKGDKQGIKNIVVPIGDLNEKVTFEVVISPEGISYDEIAFELYRTPEDKGINNGDGTHGRKINLTVNRLARLSNIVNTLPSQTLLKIGVQGTPGLLMVINGEEIRVGPSGIYEMDYPVPIRSVSFVTSDTQINQDYFVMDYQY